MKVDEKLALGTKIPPEFFIAAQHGLLNSGKISECYLMRKLKCSQSMASEIIRQIERQKIAS